MTHVYLPKQSEGEGYHVAVGGIGIMGTGLFLSVFAAIRLCFVLPIITAVFAIFITKKHLYGGLSL